MREMMEETGLHVSAITAVFTGFDYITPKKPLVRQFNFLVWTSDDEPRLSDEHDAFIWVNQDNLAELSMTQSMRELVLELLGWLKGHTGRSTVPEVIK
jgi:8-oxo-dGTP pyrophosphatase MutT (NUDIX family)